MKNKFILFALGMVLSLSLFGQDEPLPVPGQYLVILTDEAAQPVVTVKEPNNDREAGFRTGDQLRATNLSKLRNIRSSVRISEEKVIAEFADVIVGFSAQLTAEEVAALQKNPEVLEVIQDVYIALDPLTEERNPEEFKVQGQTTPCAISNAGGFQDGSGKSTWIWILDTGIDLDHPDLNVNTLSPFARSFVPGQSADDGHGHGTHCAGIAGARNNGFGTVGVSAGARVVPVKVLNNGGSGQLSWIINGLNHVAKYDIPNDVVNLSLGSYGHRNCENSSRSLRNAIRNLGNAGVWVCIAAGNSSCDAGRARPACINGNRIFTVGSMTCNQTCSSFSNWRAGVVDWVATGSQVFSTFRNGGYATLSGTSMAAPVVAGICHARAAAPVSGGNLSCGNNCVPTAAYPRARRQ